MHYFYTIPAILISFFVFCTPASAGFIIGGEITYTQVGADSFHINLTLYRNCNGLSAPQSTTLNVTSTSGGACPGTSVTLQRVPGTGQDITPMCSAFTSPCNGGSTPSIGFEEYVYEGLFVAPQSGCDYKISYELCCRWYTISNMDSPQNKGFHIYTELHSGIINHSPVFENTNAIYGFTNQLNTFNFGAIDPDGDSLVYTIIPPKTIGGSSIPYDTGYSLEYPISGDTSLFSFSSETGILEVFPTSPQVNTISVLVEEFRNGTKVGAVVRDIVLIFEDYSPTIPQLSGINGSSDYSIIAHPEDTIDFSILANGASSFQNVTLIADNKIPGASFTASGSPHQTGHFFWIPDSSHISFAPQLLKVTLKAEACPVNIFFSKIYAIYVVQPNFTDVWPGDANNDNVANIFDLLPIGIAYGSTGPARANATTLWIGQPAQDWNDHFHNGINFKYADANGDGIVDSNDVDVLYRNFGLTHNKTSGTVAETSDGDLYLVLPDTLIPGETITAPLMLGRESIPVSNFYGIVFEMSYDKDLIVENSLTIHVSQSWLGAPGNDLISLTYDFPLEGNIHAGFVRTNQQNKSGSGQIGTVEFTLREDLNENAVANFLFTNVEMIDVEENSLPVTVTQGSAIVNTPTSVNEREIAHVKLYPNPANSMFTIDAGNSIIQHIEVFDALGRKMFEERDIQNSYHHIRSASWSTGIYLVKVHVDGDVREFNVSVIN